MLRTTLENDVIVYGDPRIRRDEDGHTTYSRYLVRAKIPATYCVGLFLQLAAESAKFGVLVVTFEFEENLLTSPFFQGPSIP